MPIVARLTKHRKTSRNTCKTLWNVVKHREPLVKHHETLVKHHETLELTVHDLDIGTGCSDTVAQRSDISAWRGVSGNCHAGITRQMCNRATNPWDMGVYSWPTQRANRLIYHTDVSIFLSMAQGHCGRNTHFRRIYFGVPNFNFKNIYVKFE